MSRGHLCSIQDKQHKQQRLPITLFSARDRGGVQELGGHRRRNYARSQRQLLVLPRGVLLAHSQPQVLLEHARERREQLVRAAAVRRCAAPPCVNRNALSPECVGKWLRVRASSYGTRVLSNQAVLAYSVSRLGSGTLRSGGYSGLIRYERTRYAGGDRSDRVVLPCHSGTGSQAELGYPILRRSRSLGTQYSGSARLLRDQAVLGYSVIGWYSGTLYSGCSRVSITWQGCEERTLTPIDRRSSCDAAHVQLERYGRFKAWLRCSLCSTAHECVIRICNRMRSCRVAPRRVDVHACAHLQSADTIARRHEYPAGAPACAGRLQPSSAPCGCACSIRFGLDRRRMHAALPSPRLRDGRDGMLERGGRREQDIRGQCEPRRLPCRMLLAHSQW